MALKDIITQIPKESDKIEIVFYLKNYEYLFSDFDLKPYAQRTFSNDFLDSLKRETTDLCKEKIELKFIVPGLDRNNSKEIIIKRRLENYFKNQLKKQEKFRKKVIKQGIMFFLFGILLLIIKYSVGDHIFQKIGLNLLFVILEPLSWFLFWEGSNLLVFSSKKNKTEIEFYKKIITAKIIFDDDDY